MSRKRQREDVPEDVFVYYENTDLSSIPSGITSLRIDSSVKKIPYKAFSKQKSLVSVEYEEGLEAIGEAAFEECNSLREQQFPSTLVKIGKHAFLHCMQLEYIGRLPPNLTIIVEHAFFGCSKLQRIEIPVDSKFLMEGGVFGTCYSLTYCRLPQGMISIPSGLFYLCKSLIDVDVPPSVKKIQQRVFSGCEKLTLDELPAGLTTIGSHGFNATALKCFHSPDNVKSIHDGAFSYCRSLESVILPPELEVIEDATFECCYKLTDISIPRSITRIRRKAFAACGLTELDLSGCAIRHIGESAFSGCSHLKHIILPRTGLNRINERSFENCRSLSHLWVPPTVEYIDNGAFAGCISLLSVEVPETLKRLIFVGECEWVGELCGYESLVNIYIPPCHELDEVEEYGFMQSMKLGDAEGNYEELVDKMKRRFNVLPLHRACYFQSYHSTEENTRRIESIIRADPRSIERVDFLEMSPFHILALSSQPCIGLFQQLLSLSSSVDILKCRDVFGSTPLDYLCKNHSQAAESVTKSLLPNIMEPRIAFLGFDRWRNDVRSGLEKMQTADAASLATEVGCVCKKLARLEWMETLSLLEMAMWRLKVEEEKAIGSDARESCRINSGSSIAVEHITPFLGA